MLSGEHLLLTESNKYLPRENLNKLSLKKPPSIYLEIS